MLKGETITSGEPSACPDCGTKLVLEVLSSNAGYYLGTRCNCGPYSRETGYFKSWKVANAALLQFETGKANFLRKYWR